MSRNKLEVNFRPILESSPGLYLILQPDLSIAAVSDSYLHATMTNREKIIGQHIFEVFPDNPDDPQADGVRNLYESLQYVIKNKEPHRMAIQKYDIRKPDGTFEERFWSPYNKPTLDKDNEVAYIIHSVVDVTQEQLNLNKMKATELLLQSSIESLKDTLIFSVDKNYNYLSFNTAHKNATLEAYGIPIKPGMNLLEGISNQEDRNKVKANIEKIG